MSRRPVLGVGRLDQDVAVEPHLLAIVLADVRVIPVEPGIGEHHPGGEPFAHQHRLLGLMGSVVAVLQPEPVPVDRGLHIALVFDVDDDL